MISCTPDSPYLPIPPHTSPYLLGLPGYCQTIEVVAMAGANSQGGDEGAEDEGVGVLWVRGCVRGNMCASLPRHEIDSGIRQILDLKENWRSSSLTWFSSRKRYVLSS